MSNHLMGVSEIATFLGVSRQRADQIARTKGFPDPVAELAAGRVWETASVTSWVKESDGRMLHHTKKSVPGLPSGLPQRCYACGQRLEYVDRGEGALSLECPDITLDSLDDHEASREAARLNDVLCARQGWQPDQVTEWWNTPNVALDGDSPTGVWLRGDRSIVRSLIEETRDKLINYQSLQEALRIARDEFLDERRDLAARGPGHVMIGRVRNVDGQFDLESVTVMAELEWERAPGEYVVMRPDRLKCPVCAKEGTAGGEWRASNALGGIVTGLDPATCVGCHDTLTTHGIAPRLFAENGSSIAIERPAVVSH